ncbi:MAG: A/G-specific adenine glycosylase [Cryomorphaceae bacterium]|nr:A/G-specific adenine glycosylase [Cryomorphaceae bacterium]
MKNIEICQHIENWYLKNKRELPWRSNPQPYEVWLAEIVFQQTRISQGMGHYLQLLERFPNVEILSKATEDDVLKCWEGLGYYTRARNLRKGAIYIAQLGDFPKTYDDWLAVPGVGPYTAGVISSVCFRQKVPVVDGNVMRVLSRMFLISSDIRIVKTQQIFRNIASDLVQSAIHPGNFNQGMMELGALICKPKNPDCAACPLSEFCELYITGENPGDFPYKSSAKEKTNRYFHFFFASNANGLLLKRREASDIWNGLYVLPFYEGEKLPFDAPEYLMEKSTHILTHQKIHYYIWDVVNWDAVPQNLIDDCEIFSRDVDFPAMPRPLQLFIKKYLHIK